MTPTGTKTGTQNTLTEKLDAKRREEGDLEVVPEKAIAPAEILPPQKGEVHLSLSLSLSEIGCIAASLQTCVQWRAITQPSQLNIVNSVLRKFHDAKLQWVKEHPDA